MTRHLKNQIATALAGVLALWSCGSTGNTSGGNAPAGMVLIPAGQYVPLFRAEKDPKEIPVSAFYLDVFPVTNDEYLEFVRANPMWRRSQIKRLFADEDYLKLWASDLEIGANVAANAPVTHVSWFAAKAYAVWKDKRLPRTAEWEYAAAASATRRDGENDPEFVRQIHAWYTTPTPERLPVVGAGSPNVFGIHDLHGLVWEWVGDFNIPMATGNAGSDRDLFCGGGAKDAKDRTNFPAFMRYGFRSSLKASYTVHNLGFRCAKSLDGEVR